MRHVAAAVLVAVAVAGPVRAESLTDFTRCLTRRGMRMYGASWCAACRAFLDRLERAADYLDYVECDDPATGLPLEECASEGIRTFPTFDFRTGARLTGVVPLTRLAERTGCRLPGRPGNGS